MLESPTSEDSLLSRYKRLQEYVRWADTDAVRLAAVAARLETLLPELVEDFYDEIQRHEATRRIVTGGEEQFNRLKGTLHIWLRELLHGPYDEAYIRRRFRVGWRHVEIGLPSVFTNVAMSRIRTRLTQAMMEGWEGDPTGLSATVVALQKRIDLDLALIEEAYQSEHALRLQRSERLITLGQVAGGIAHELRNPLNVIKTSAYYLRSARSLTPEKQVEHLQRVERNVELADGVITALSNFAKMPVPKLEPVGVARLVRDTLQNESLGRLIEVLCDLPDDLPPVLADAPQLRIVLGNLLRNARDAMPQGGQIIVRGRAEGERVAISVSDSGVGIPDEQIHRIMEPLFSTKARGLGLGLAIVRSILEKGEGQLAVTSEPGQGSVFTITLRAAPVPSRSSTPQA